MIVQLSPSAEFDKAYTELREAEAEFKSADSDRAGALARLNEARHRVGILFNERIRAAERRSNEQASSELAEK